MIAISSQAKVIMGETSFKAIWILGVITTVKLNAVFDLTDFSSCAVSFGAFEKAVLRKPIRRGRMDGHIEITDIMRETKDVVMFLYFTTL